MEPLIFYITSLFTMINPLGSVPLFIALTEGFNRRQVRKTAIKASVTAFIALTIFALAGKLIFDFFGISIEGLRVVGGVLFFLMGYEMLRGRTVPKKLDHETEKEFSSDIAITPLAIPMIAGPGAITMVILFIQEAHTIGAKATLVGSILFVCFLTGLILLSGKRILQALGPSGSKVMMRIMGLIVMLIAVEFFFAGITPYVRNILMLES